MAITARMKEQSMSYQCRHSTERRGNAHGRANLVMNLGNVDFITGGVLPHSALYTMFVVVSA